METSNAATQGLTVGRVIPPVEIEEDVAEDNFGPSVEACVWALAVLAAGWLGLRLYLKFQKHRGLWWDDRFLAIVSNIIMSYIFPALTTTRRRRLPTWLYSSLGSSSYFLYHLGTNAFANKTF